MAVSADEGTTSLVSLPHFAPQRSWDRASPRSGTRLGGAGLVGDAGLLLQHLGEQCVERSFDDDRGIAVRNLMWHQILKLLELGSRSFAQGDLELVAARRERYGIG